MSQITASGQSSMMDDGNIRLGQSTWSMVSNAALLVGLVGLLAAGIGLFTSPKNALAGIHMGAIIATGLGLGGMFFTMAFHLTGAGWSTTVRRQFENLVWCLPIAMVLVIISVALNLWGGFELASWKNAAVTAEEHFITKKELWLSDVFVLVRLGIYFAVWLWLRHILWSSSVRQDSTGDPRLSNRARFHSSYGMLIFAFTSTFFAFDWLMSLADYRFFSTMWGVYYFAGNILAAVQVVILVLAGLIRSGRLKGIVTDEHLHDLAKFAFAFTVFWAYIAFGQYFLIWYANLPEETAFFVYRKEHWPLLTTTLAIGHFIVPFYILLWRPVRRNWALMSVMAIYLLVMHVLDIYWIVRPAVDMGEAAAHPTSDFGTLAIEVAGIVGVLALFTGVLLRRVASGPLIPIKDPKLPEALHHKNYV